MRMFDALAARPRDGGYHSTIITTFAIEFGAFERILLPQFTGAGASNILLLADPGMTATALDEGFSLPKLAGRDYVVHSPGGQTGVFHPKIIFQVGRKGARVIVGSANSTSAGLAGNWEVVSKVECSTADSPERAFAVAVWEYLLRLARDAGAPTQAALRWLETRTPWLASAQDNPELRAWELADGTGLGFFASQSAEDSPILSRFVDAVGEGPISRLVIASPYWDGGLVAVRNLMAALRPTETFLCFQPGQALFPKDALGRLDVKLVELDLKGKRFSHAKVIVATRGGYDHILSGSTNCTLAALGSRDIGGANAEASIYRRLPAGRGIEALGLEATLGGAAISLANIPDLVEDPPLPLVEAIGRSGGTFEVKQSIVAWRPPAGLDLGHAEVDLLSDLAAEPCHVLSPTDWRREDGALFAQLPQSADLIRFACVRVGGWRSTPAIVVDSEVLRQKRRERASQRVEKAEIALRGRQRLNLEVLELLNILEREDEEVEASIVAARRTSSARNESRDQLGRQLDYETFLRVRRPVEAGGEGQRNASAGGGVNVMRQFLNDLVQDGLPATSDQKAEDQLLTGMEEEEGLLDDPTPRSTRSPTPNLLPAPEQTVDRVELEKAVAKYQKAIAAKAEKGSIGASEVLRLRLWLMLILSNRHVLDLDVSEQGWPRLTLRILTAFFHGKSAPITRLAMDPAHEHMPLDFVEAWAAVLVALEKLAQLTDGPLGADEAGRRFLHHVDVLDRVIRPRMGLTLEELASPELAEAEVQLGEYLARVEATARDAGTPDRIEEPA